MRPGQFQPRVGTQGPSPLQAPALERGGENIL